MDNNNCIDDNNRRWTTETTTTIGDGQQITRKPMSNPRWYELNDKDNNNDSSNNDNDNCHYSINENNSNADNKNDIKINIDNNNNNCYDPHFVRSLSRRGDGRNRLVPLSKQQRRDPSNNGAIQSTTAAI